MYELDVLVNGKSVVKYPHKDLVFIEGREGTEYTVRMRNNSYEKVVAVVSVDGLSVMDGEEASFDSIGYVIDPYSTVDVPGWRLDNENVARFKFGARGATYADQKGKPENVGVIGCAVFRLKSYEIVVPRQQYVKGPIKWPGPYTKKAPYTIVIGDSTYEPGDVTYDTCNVSGVTRTATTETSGNSCSNSCSNNSYKVTYSSNSSAMDYKTESTQYLGTEFGSKQQHVVQEIVAERQPSPDAVIEIHYDSREGLEQRGINLGKSLPKIARAFKDSKGVGCTPPKNWRGHHTY